MLMQFVYFIKIKHDSHSHSLISAYFKTLISIENTFLSWYISADTSINLK
jgi:hypothetical protein